MKPVDDNCGECDKPVHVAVRQQIFFYPSSGEKIVKLAQKKLTADSPGVWRRVCGPCLLKLRPETRQAASQNLWRSAQRA
jgi:hypothetical protein